MDKYLLHKIMELLVCAEGGCRSRGFGGEARQPLLGKFWRRGGSKWGGPLRGCPAFERSCSTLQISKSRNLIFESLKVVFGILMCGFFLVGGGGIGKKMVWDVC